jgi:hypothetical protein
MIANEEIASLVLSIQYDREEGDVVVASLLLHNGMIVRGECRDLMSKHGIDITPEETAVADAVAKLAMFEMYRKKENRRQVSMKVAGF